MEEVRGLWALILTMAMSVVIVVWLCCSVIQSFLNMRQRHKELRYKTLLRENQRLKHLLADSAKEYHFRKVHRTELVCRKSNRVGRRVA